MTFKPKITIFIDQITKSIMIWQDSPGITWCHRNQKLASNRCYALHDCARSPLHMETSVWWFFADWKLTDIAKNLNNIIKTSWKVMTILKIWRVWLKNQARHAHLYFELKMAANRSILELQKKLKNLFSQKNYFSWGLFSSFLL